MLLRLEGSATARNRRVGLDDNVEAVAERAGVLAEIVCALRIENRCSARVHSAIELAVTRKPIGLTGLYDRLDLIGRLPLLQDESVGSRPIDGQISLTQ